MSSYDGTATQKGQSTDAALQLAPTGESGPDFGALKKAFEDCVIGNSPYIDQCRQNFRTRYAIWDNQSSDGKKHARAGQGQPEVVPWDGASDLRVYQADEVVNGKVSMLSTAFRKANVVAVPVEGNDLKRAKTVSNFMRWLIQTQVPEIRREVKLLANYIQEKGVAVTGQFWEVIQEKTLTTVDLQGLAQQFPQLNMAELIFVEEAADNLLAIFEEMYGCSRAKAKKMLRDLRDKQTTTVPTVGRTRSRPVVRAFNLDEDLFIPDSATDIETASGIYRVQYFNPEQLRAFVNTDGWDADWVEAAIKTCRGRYISIAQNQYTEPQSRSFIYNEQRMTDLIGVVYAYQRLSDEDGVPGIYCTIFNPELPPNADQPGYAKFGLLGYAHGRMPFVLFRREYLSRKLHDTRGVPEPALPWQQQIKVHYDSRVDAASLAILPPMMYPAGRPPGRWGAGARVPERRTGEYHYADRPMPDMNTEKSQELLQTSFDRYFARSTREQDPFAQSKNQDEVEDFLEGWSGVMNQIWHLFNQFGPEEVFFRVIGLRQADAMQFNKGDLNEEFDFVLKFSLDSLDPEQTFAKLEQIAKIVQTADRDGVVNYSEWLQVMVEAVDPTIAERIIDPKNVGSQRVVSEMQDLLAKVYAGQDQDIKMGTPPDLGLQVIQGYVQGDPVVQARMQNKQDPFAQRIEKLAKQLQFEKTQANNAKIGRLGA